MKHRRFLTVLLTLCLCIVLLAMTASATELDDKNTGYLIHYTRSAGASEGDYAQSIEDAAEQLRQKMRSRTSSVTISYAMTDGDFTGTSSEIKAVSRSIMNEALAHTGEPTEGDYIAKVISRWSVSIGYSSSGNTWYFDCNYTLYYYTTAAQEKKVTAAVEELLDTLIVSGEMTDYQKLRVIYDWMAQNITYDYDNLYDSDYTLKYTAYAALIDRTSVCQGYATLLYRLLLEVGVDCRVISGVGNGGPHGWNIVELDGEYYDVDVTWDAAYAQAGLDYAYFLCSDDAFDNHTRDEEYATVEFYRQYPMACASYSPAHTFGDWVVEREASCTEEGQRYHECGICGLREYQMLDILDHKFGSWKVTQAATCAVPGWKVRSCTVCGESVGRLIEETEDHSYTACVTKPTCTKKGYTTYTCGECGDQYKDDEVDCTGHSYGNWVLSYEATCVDSGLEYCLCRDCNAQKSRIIAPTEEHDYVKGVCSQCGDKTTYVEAPKAKVTNVASTGKIKISWNKVEGATKYMVYRSTSKNSGYKRLTTTDKNYVINKSIDAGEGYYYYVVAVAKDGTKSAKSNKVYRTCDLARPEIKLTNVASTGKIKVSWEAVEGATKYEVYRATGKNGTYKRIITTKNLYVLNKSTDAGKTYYYKVRAICGVSAATSAYSAVGYRCCDLARPVATVKLNTKGKPVVKWDAVEGAVRYVVYIYRNGELIKASTVSGTKLTHSSAVKGRTYTYRVQAIHSTSSANSAKSASVKITSK